MTLPTNYKSVNDWSVVTSPVVNVALVAQVYWLFEYCSSHFLGMSFNPNCSDLFDTGGPIRSEDKPEQFCHEIVVFFAVHGVGKLFAVGTALELVFHIAGSDAAPGCLFIRMASRTGSFQIFTAGATI